MMRFTPFPSTQTFPLNSRSSEEISSSVSGVMVSVEASSSAFTIRF
jgi:hypothetical protein